MKKLFWGAVTALAAFGAYRLLVKEESKRMRGVVSEIDRENKTFKIQPVDNPEETVRFKVTPHTTFSWLAMLHSAKNTAAFDDLTENADVLVVYHRGCCLQAHCSRPDVARHVVLEKVQ